MSGEWYRKHHRGALAHRLGEWLEGRNGSSLLAMCGKEVTEQWPLRAVGPPVIDLVTPQPSGYCRRCCRLTGTALVR